ncbi:hypothetical protein [Yersinia intermedia]|uniref:hypothetical protein n=1 Tax=Yersinia intermedia TaxID=631 RepID=UPI001CFE0718|nr:hypothetical protein [Yersinia intermedia]MCB5312100.1 hypothetical protein [Yersinia intermedia]MCB5326154.1 hypothetical protein [Yersinia intermedia]
MTEKVLNITDFEIKYNGNELGGPKEHQIDARILGNAITSLCDIIEQSDKIINGEASNVQVNVKAHQEGSFEVVVSVAQQSNNINILEVLGLTKEIASVAAGVSVGTVLGAIKWLKGRKLAEVAVDEKKGTARLLTKDDEEIECPIIVQKLLTSPTIRKGFDELVYKPLSSEGISTFSVENNDKPLITVTEEDKKSFKALRSLVKEEKFTETVTANVHISCVNFLAKTGWKMILPDGKEVAATMNDQAFIERINLNKATFSKDDLFVVEYTQTQIQANEKLGRPRYEIERVVRHRAVGDRKIV